MRSNYRQDGQDIFATYYLDDFLAYPVAEVFDVVLCDSRPDQGFAVVHLEAYAILEIVCFGGDVHDGRFTRLCELRDDFITLELLFADPGDGLALYSC